MTPGSMMPSSNAQGTAPFQRAPLQAVNSRFHAQADSNPQEQDSATKTAPRAEKAPLMNAFTAHNDGRQARPSPPERGFPSNNDAHVYGGGYPHSTPSSHQRNNYNSHFSGMMSHMRNHNMMYPQRPGRVFPPFHGMTHFPFQHMNYQSTPMAHGHFNRPARNTPEFSHSGDNVQYRMHELAVANSQSSDDHNNMDSPRSPSPPPAPPKQAPSSAPPKIHTDRLQRKNKPQNNQRLSLEESFGKTLVDSRPHKTSAFHKVEKSAPKTTGKATPSVQDASLLLGLRSNSASKSPVPRSIPHHDIALDTADEIIKATVSELGTSPSSSSPINTIPKDYPKRLAMPSDKLHLNSLHCFIRSELLELFVIEPGKDSTSNTMTGRIGLQCVHCAAARSNDPKRENEATMAVFYPRSCNEIYRLVTNWTRCHLRKCKNLPPTVRKEWDLLRAVDKSRGKTQYWADSAKQLGLMDCTQTRAGGVRFRDDATFRSQENNKKETSR